MVDVRRLAVGAGIAAAAAVVAFGAGKYVARRARTASDPAAGEDFDGLADLGVMHREVPTRDGGRVHLLEKGVGRPVVLVHGVTLQAGVWRYQFSLADRHRVIAMSQRGHGRSAAGTGGYGLDRLADDLCDVLETLDLHDAVVVGHSMGGMAIMRFAHRHPDVRAARIAGIVLVATTAEPVVGFGAARRYRRVGQAVDRRGQAYGWEKVPALAPRDTDFGYAFTRLAFGDRARPHHVELTRRMVAEMGREAFHRSVVGLLENDELEPLATVDTPTLVVVGTRDALTPAWHSRRIANAMPDAELVVLPRAGHQLMLERPDELSSLIEGMVLRTGSAATSAGAPSPGVPGEP